MTKTYPRIYLAVDNCFASKRWTNPSEWLKIAKDVGINYVEASADNECDPLYSTGKYLQRWKEEIIEGFEKTGVKVANLYSGHGTYSTLGLSHPDSSVRNNIKNNWLKRMIDLASELDAGLGFYTHAFNMETLMNVSKYNDMTEILYNSLSELSAYAAEKSIQTIGIEQMYTPHQIPWTIAGSEKLIRTVSNRSNTPFYLTIDTGHQSGQYKFFNPTPELILDYLRTKKETESVDHIWLGHESNYSLLLGAEMKSESQQLDIIEKIIEKNKDYPHLFAQTEDPDPYKWIEKLGAYSPIIHLQQTDGRTSSHLPFTPERNSWGIIDAGKIIEALKKAWENLPETIEQTPVNEIFLTLELFAPTASLPVQIIENLKASASYWRKYIPSDGMYLNEL